MKDLLYSALVLLFVTLFTAILPTDAEAEIYEDTLRLHILASSDSKEDQEIKLYVRDKLLLEYGELLSSASNCDEAVSFSEEVRGDIEESVNEWLSEKNYSDSATVTVTEEWYDVREYEDFTLPSGYYKSLRVIIGCGEGKNWWCVMYPPLCMEIATEKAPSDDALIKYSDEEIKLITSKKFNVKFKILDTLSKAFAKIG